MTRWKKALQQVIRIVLITVGLLPSLSNAANAQANQTQEIATAEEIKGSVSRRQGGGDPRDLAAGARLVRDETITTSGQSTAAIRLDDNSRLRIGERSSVTLNRVVFNPTRTSGEAVVQVTRGAIRFASGRMPSESYKIETPTATIGVRGTEFSVVVDGDGRTTTVLHSGQVSVTNSTGFSVTIDRPGDASVIARGRGGQILPPTDPRPAEQILRGGNSTLDRILGLPPGTRGTGLPEAPTQQPGAGPPPQTQQRGDLPANPQGPTTNNAGSQSPDDDRQRVISAGTNGNLNVPQLPTGNQTAGQSQNANVARGTSTNGISSSGSGVPSTDAETPLGDGTRIVDAYGNAIDLNLSGSFNVLQINTTGPGANLSVTQSGTSNSLVLDPINTGMTSRITQGGQGNVGRAGGGGKDTTYTLEQTGTGHRANIVSEGGDLKVIVRQGGAGHSAEVLGRGTPGGTATVEQLNSRANAVAVEVGGRGVNIQINQR